MSSFYNITNSSLNNNSVQLYCGDINVSASYNTSVVKPAFWGYISTSKTNVTGDGSDYPVGTAANFTTVYQRGISVNSSAKITFQHSGLYQINVNSTISSSATNASYITLTTNLYNSGQTIYFYNQGVRRVLPSTNPQFTGEAVFQYYFTAGQTWTISINATQNPSGKTVGLVGSPSYPSNIYSTISGFMI